MTRPILKLKTSPPPSAEPKPVLPTPPKDRKAARFALYVVFPDLLEYRPLAIGIDKVMRPVYKAVSGLAGEDFSAAMHAHTTDSKYLYSCREAGALRYGADGKPQGEVDLKAALRARKILGERLKKKRAREAKQ